MYINRAVLLALGILLVFLPAIEQWAFHSASAWYRPHQLWLLIILAAYWNRSSRYPDEF
jgi:hypothetical protein